MGTQQFCLRWNNHQINMLNVFENLLHNEALVDVTLACEGLTLKAHKVVLSACSPYFQALFIENPCKHPIVILKDVRYTDLKALIDFMYKGEVNVAQDQLNALLNTAETLKIKGLAEVTGGGVSVNPAHEPQLQLLPSRTHGGSSSSGTPSSPPPPQHNLPPTHLSESTKHLQLPLPPHLQSLSNTSASSQLPPLSPPPKRRKTKPRKRITESTLISSDQEDSDALDLATTTTTPEMIETCVDLPESSSECDRMMEPTETKPMPLLEPLQIPSQSTRPPHLESTDEMNTLGDKSHTSINQNQFSITASSLLPQRLPILPKLPLGSVLPPSSSSPIPSTSTTQATTQDPAGWPERKKREYHCEHCQMSFESKKIFYKHGCPRLRVGFTCDICGSYFPTHCRYSRHRQIHNPDREIYTCLYCPKTMVRMDHLKQHMKNAHGLV